MADEADGQPPNALDEFATRLNKARSKSGLEANENQRLGGGLGAGMKLASELIAAFAVGALLGWGLDRAAGTAPWGLIGGVLFGFAAGVRNAYATLRKHESEPPAPGPNKEDEKRPKG